MSGVVEFAARLLLAPRDQTTTFYREYLTVVLFIVAGVVCAARSRWGFGTIQA